MHVCFFFIDTYILVGVFLCFAELTRARRPIRAGSKAQCIYPPDVDAVLPPESAACDIAPLFGRN